MSDRTEQRVLVLAPTGRDGEMIGRVMSGAGIDIVECSTMTELCRKIREGAGTAIVAGEALGFGGRRSLAAVLDRQPGWSELPLILMAANGESRNVWKLLEESKAAAHGLLLRRPVHTATLVSAVRAGLGSRRRQYVIRDELVQRRETEDALRRSEAQLREAAETLEARVAERTEEIERRTRRMRLLAERLGKAEERERRRLSETLHDGLQQLLVAIRMKVQSAPGDPEALVRVESMLSEAVESTRSLAYELSPPVAQVDLPLAMDWLAHWFRKNHGFEVTVEVEGECPGLPQEVKQVLFTTVRELLLNSIKHSGGREATVRIERGGEDVVRIEVRDEGVGFDPARVERAADQGVGFGLLAASERLRSIHGTLAIDSAPGKGARFRLSQPLPRQWPGGAGRATSDDAPAEPTEPRREAPPPLTVGGHEHPIECYRGEAGRRPVRVLIADDHRMFRDGVVSMLRRCDDVALVGVADDGVEAVERVRELRPDVVLMDINMPRMDGIQATRKIKRAYPEVRIVGLSMHSAEHAQVMRRAGASEYLSKDLPADKLVETIRSLFP